MRFLVNVLLRCVRVFGGSFLVSSLMSRGVG